MELGVPLLAMVLQFIIVFLLLSGLKVVSFSLIPSLSSPCLLVWSYKAYTSVICGCCRDANISLDLDYFQRMSDADSVVYGAVKSIPGITTHFEEPEKINMCRFGHLNEKQSNKLIVSSCLQPHARRLIHTCTRVGLS